MNKDAHLLGLQQDEGTVDFVVGGMVPSIPFERDGERMVIKIYDQQGILCPLCIRHTKGNEMFGVWLRRFDRYQGAR